jgi:transketolase
MRTAFITTLIELARNDERIFLLIGDLGYSVVEPFAREFPDRFVNVGVAEQNMTGVATGLALSGKIVFTYSIGNFPILRCLEQIRNDVCYHNADVKIVAVGGGLAYGALGTTHHCTEGIAIMRALPNMTVVAPGDPMESALATRAVVEHPGPCYLRLGKTGETIIHHKIPNFKLGKAIVVRGGSDVTLIATGGMLHSAVQAAEELAADGIKARVLSMHTVKPLDNEAVLAAAKETGKIITIEEHTIIGGLGSAVAEVLAEHGNSKAILKRIGIKDLFCTEVGSQEHLRKVYSLSVEDIVLVARSLVGRQS